MKNRTEMLANLQQPVRNWDCENREIPPGLWLFHNLVSAQFACLPISEFNAGKEIAVTERFLSLELRETR